MYKAFFKRAFDIVIAVPVFIISLPVSLIIMILLAWDHKGTPFFIQVRPGLHGKLFRIIKFKTMTDEKDSHGKLLSDAQRFTGIGAFLRRTSLDEIPQLLNVIMGEMSLVGPRPLLPEYLPLYNAFQFRRHEVLPGITGWAQVNGRNAISWEKKFEFDVWYVDHLRFSNDVKILFLTVKKILRKEDVNASSLVTMSKFTGNPDQS